MKVFRVCFKLYFVTGFITQCIYRTGRLQTEFRCAGSESQILDPVVITTSNQLAFGRASAVDGHLMIDKNGKRLEILCQNFE